ncbi:hypothetical protein CDCA_CDCA08G2293 [Cyanidium caldarium]|uniref:Uncharacterized protein n=1 Tax=Cyanidium caldarium TaxID=2771 RepID=A0AAV9IWT2_CYACA|nr:hypothetical protein CDCA_CDCA08G2293 [Cyanidium caldarium]
MSLLYGKSALWRWLVYQTTLSPWRALAVSGSFLAVGLGTGWALLGANERFGGGGAAARDAELRRKLARDPEAQRYAQHSKDALAAIFAQVQSPSNTPSLPRDATHTSAQPLRIPGVAWHPRAS